MVRISTAPCSSYGLSLIPLVSSIRHHHRLRFFSMQHSRFIARWGLAPILEVINLLLTITQWILPLCLFIARWGRAPILEVIVFLLTITQRIVPLCLFIARWGWAAILEAINLLVTIT